MSALGQKRTFALQSHVRLHYRKQTYAMQNDLSAKGHYAVAYAVQKAISAMCHKQTFAPWFENGKSS